MQRKKDRKEAYLYQTLAAFQTFWNNSVQQVAQHGGDGSDCIRLTDDAYILRLHSGHTLIVRWVSHWLTPSPAFLVLAE